jgi:hypothetical protein
MDYQLTWEPGGVYKKLSGFVTAKELLHSVTDVQSDRRFDDMRYVITDLTDTTGYELSEELFADLAAIHCGAQASNPNCRIIFVTPDKTLAKIIGDTLRSPHLISYVVEVKSTIGEARDWLDSQPRQHEVSCIMGERFN